jgi:hypothetical protein
MEIADAPQRPQWKADSFFRRYAGGRESKPLSVIAVASPGPTAGAPVAPCAAPLFSRHAAVAYGCDKS